MDEKYDIIIGLEIHVQTKTNSKMFCSCNAQYFEKEPNTQVCPVCMGLPGALPVPNKRAVEKCILLGLATNCKISENIRFDRKHYFYPDLPKGYQISQYENPICSNGDVNISNKKGEKVKIELERIHQEEDVAKSLHTKNGYTLIDCNKSGVPLIEIVTKPVIKTAYDAKEFASRIRQIVRYLNISDADMEKGQMRCEPNISVQKKGTWEYKDGKILPLGSSKLNPKIEIKNIGSITAVEKSIDYEIKRIINEIEGNKEIIQQTRGWDAQKNATEFQRAKESAQDYRYCPDPDIPVITIDKKTKEKIKLELVELPDEKIEKYTTKYNLSNYDAEVLSSSKENTIFFEKLLKKVACTIDEKKAAKTVANWILGPIFNHINTTNNTLKDLEKFLDNFSALIIKVEKKELLNSKAKEILEKSLSEGLDLEKLLENECGNIISSQQELEKLAQQVIGENPNAVADFKNGKQNAIGFLTGQIMKLSQGNADPVIAKEILTKLMK
jgi:aspartyl-tRNA(Asn)/glutamyl-tRNA(Gln) amidotransferase subunit B